MHSRKGRDVMHLIVSARAGTEVSTFQDAVRDFLGEEFAGHRYVFAVHDPPDDPREMAEGGKRPHIHAHAIVTMRSETGKRIVTSPQVFREWRELMAEKAREHDIDMELTDRRGSGTSAGLHAQPGAPSQLCRPDRTRGHKRSRAGPLRCETRECRDVVHR
jgi:hypothetical protein